MSESELLTNQLYNDDPKAYITLRLVGLRFLRSRTSTNVADEHHEDIIHDSWLILITRIKKSNTQLLNVRSYFIKICQTMAYRLNIVRTSHREKETEYKNLFSTHSELKVDHIGMNFEAFIEKLPERSKMLFRLKFIDGLNDSEIAEQGFEYEMVRKLYYKGLKSCRKTINRHL